MASQNLTKSWLAGTAGLIVGTVAVIGYLEAKLEPMQSDITALKVGQAATNAKLDMVLDGKTLRASGPGESVAANPVINARAAGR